MAKHTVTPCRPAAQGYRLPRVFYGAVVLQVITLSLLFVGDPWGLYVSTFLQSILGWSMVVIVYIDVRLRFAPRDPDLLDCTCGCQDFAGGLCLYHHLRAHLDHEKQRIDRSGGAVSVLQIHVDDAGESALNRVGELVRDAMSGHVILGRAGAQDLLAVLPRTDRKKASSIAQRLRRALTGSDREAGGSEKVNVGSLSITVATYPTDGDSIGEVLAAANRAFAESHERGRAQEAANVLVRGEAHSAGC